MSAPGRKVAFVRVPFLVAEAPKPDTDWPRVKALICPEAHIRWTAALQCMWPLDWPFGTIDGPLRKSVRLEVPLLGLSDGLPPIASDPPGACSLA